MYTHLKMLLNINGAIPTVEALQSFWKKTARQKLEHLQKEKLEGKPDYQ
jgi:hypothetical protein